MPQPIRRAAVPAILCLAAGTAAFFSGPPGGALRAGEDPPAATAREKVKALEGKVAASRSAPPADGTLSADFKRAIGLFLHPSPEKRAEGRRLIRRMGERGVIQLTAWITQAAGDVDRARALLATLGGSESPDDLLSEARPFLLREAAEAWNRFHAGEYREAKRKAEAVLALDPESPELWTLRRLARQCDDRLISKEILEPTAEFREIVYTFEDVPKLLFRLVSRSKGPVAIRTDRGNLASFRVTIDRRFLDGSEKSEERTVSIRLREEERLSLQPGESYEREVPVYFDRPKPEPACAGCGKELGWMEIPGPGRCPRCRRDYDLRVSTSFKLAPVLGMVIRIRATGNFAPAELEVEARNFSRVVPIAPAECWMVPEPERSLADAPIRKLESAVFLRDLQGYFVAGNLSAWAGEGDRLLNERLLRILVESLGDLDSTGLQVAEPLLERASGLRREGKASPAEVARHWKEWWESRKGRAGEGGTGTREAPPEDR